MKNVQLQLKHAVICRSTTLPATVKNRRKYADMENQCLRSCLGSDLNLSTNNSPLLSEAKLLSLKHYVLTISAYLTGFFMKIPHISQGVEQPTTLSLGTELQCADRGYASVHGRFMVHSVTTTAWVACLTPKGSHSTFSELKLSTKWQVMSTLVNIF